MLKVVLNSFFFFKFRGRDRVCCFGINNCVNSGFALLLHKNISLVCLLSDPFLPHVTELAITSSDRQTKVAACELLHSMLLYSIGRGAAQPGAHVQRASMAPLFQHIFPAMLKLACAVELVSV